MAGALSKCAATTFFGGNDYFLYAGSDSPGWQAIQTMPFDGNCSATRKRSEKGPMIDLRKAKSCSCRNNLLRRKRRPSKSGKTRHTKQDPRGEGWLHQDGTTGLPLKLSAFHSPARSPRQPLPDGQAAQGGQVEAIEGEDACKRRVSSSSAALAEAAAYIFKNANAARAALRGRRSPGLEAS